MVTFVLCLTDDKANGNNFLSHYKLFDYFGVCWKFDILCLLSFVSWVYIWPEWNEILFQDKRGGEVYGKCQGISNCFGTGIFYQRMSCMYRLIHTLIFCSHSMFYSRQNCLGRNTSGHEVSHSHSCCTRSTFQYSVCLVIVHHGKRALRSISSYWNSSGQGECANWYGSHW